jgi:hypothetical protein
MDPSAAESVTLTRLAQSEKLSSPIKVTLFVSVTDTRAWQPLKAKSPT